MLCHFCFGLVASASRYLIPRCLLTIIGHGFHFLGPIMPGALQRIFTYANQRLSHHEIAGARLL